MLATSFYKHTNKVYLYFVNNIDEYFMCAKQRNSSLKSISYDYHGNGHQSIVKILEHILLHSFNFCVSYNEKKMHQSARFYASLSTHPMQAPK